MFYCFGCQKSGDAITFIRELEHLDFVEAVERLAARVPASHSATTTPRSPQDRQAQATVARGGGGGDRVLPRPAARAPSARATRGATCAAAASTATSARRFSLGWSPDGYDALSRHLQQKKFSRDDIVDAGLAFVNKAQQAAGLVPRPGDVPDLRRARRPGRASAAGRSTRDGPKYKNTAGDAALPEVAGCSTA